MFNQKKIVAEEWHREAKNINISSQAMNRLVLNFFIVEGYKESALSFSRQTGIEISEEQLKLMDERIELKQQILNGEVEKAMEHFTNEVPVTLKVQKLIEFMRDGKLAEAIEYAQQVMVEHLDQNPQLINEIAQALAILIYQNDTCPYRDLLSQGQRIKVSSEVNTEILKAAGQQDARLTLLIKVLIWAQKTLAGKIDFPAIIDIQTAQFQKS